MEEIPHTAIPETLKEDVARFLADHSLGFLRLENTRQGQDAVLLGSGTLVKIDNIYAVLTAHHVLKELPSKGRLGLILAYSLEAHSVDIQGLEYRKIARGTKDSDGPDLGAVILAPSIARSIAAIKTFYDLNLHRDQLLESPPDLHDGIWFVHGFIDEKTAEEPARHGYGRIKRFSQFSYLGLPEPPISVEDHDYFDFPVSYGGRSVAPRSFGGMSGGGLWQVPITRDEQGTLRQKIPLLSGVAFYQEPTTETSCGVKCHGRSSVYRIAYEAIRKNGC